MTVEVDTTARERVAMIPGETIADLEREVAVFVHQERAASGRLGRETHPDLTSATYGPGGPAGPTTVGTGPLRSPSTWA
jgi:hypothetical protein